MHKKGSFCVQTPATNWALSKSFWRSLVVQPQSPFSSLCSAWLRVIMLNMKSSILRLIVDIPCLTSHKVQDSNTIENIAKNVPL